MRILIALGGNALICKGQPLTADNQIKHIKRAAAQIAKLAPNNQLVITHGNGPQVGLLALQAVAYKPVTPYPLDMLGAETEGMIGYLLEQEIANCLSPSRHVATLLTRVEVKSDDPCFTHPTKPIGPIYSSSEVLNIQRETQWTMVFEKAGYRRVVPSPQPQRILEIDPILWLLAHEVIVIAAGGGGIPVIISGNGHTGVEAVIDKDLCSSLLAKEIGADCLLIATDVEFVYKDWGKPTQQPIREISFTELSGMDFNAGSMGPKVKAACQFVEATQNIAVIGAIDQITAMLQGTAGTRIL